MTFKQLCKLFYFILIGTGIFSAIIIFTVTNINNIFFNVILVFGYVFLLMWILLCTKLGNKLWEWSEK